MARRIAFRAVKGAARFNANDLTAASPGLPGLPNFGGLPDDCIGIGQTCDSAIAGLADIREEPVERDAVGAVLPTGVLHARRLDG